MKPIPLSDLPKKYHEQVSYQLGRAAYQPHGLTKTEKRRARSVVQEWEDAFAGATHNLPDKAEVDAPGLPRYRITITLRTSDNRDRDGDGAISTLLDTYLFALGRLLEVDRGALRGLAKSEERRGGG